MCSRIAPVLIAGLMLAVAAPVGAADHISVTGTGRHLGADGAQSGNADRIAGFPLSPTPPVECPQLFFEVPVVSGNYVIHGARS
jgi:hypothetical protein